MSAPAAQQEAPARCELAVVGGGILGLALARELTLRMPDRRVCVLEREAQLAMHQSAHNSGVVHAGIYYEPGSLKARLCVAGARRIYEYCEQHAIPHVRCGKVILAREQHELPRLQELERRARANGVAGVRLLDAAGVSDLEPHARALAGLHSPGTGVIDFRALALSFAREVRERGGTIATGCGVRSVAREPSALLLEHARGTLRAEHAIFCAGAWSDRLASAAGAPTDPRIVPFRGAYLRLEHDRRHLVRALIYPVPDPALPFLGVHLSRRIDGELLIGPTATIAATRNCDRPNGGWPKNARPAGPARLRRAPLRDTFETLAWPGTWRLLARSRRSAARELFHAAVPSTLVRQAAQLVPELAGAEVLPAFSGVRAQALARDGSLVDDFAFSITERALHVRNAPSPAATSSMAIATMIVDEAARVFELRARSDRELRSS